MNDITLPTDLVLQMWTETNNASCSIVLPDGCRDLILKTSPHTHSEWFISELNDSAYMVENSDNAAYLGFRLHPGAIIQEEALLKAVRLSPIIDNETIYNYLNDNVRYNENITEALTVLAHAQSITSASKQLGVSQRQLERFVMQQTKRAPMYWKRLARVRKTAKILINNQSALADIATLSYSDQAHMSRDFQYWFNTSPSIFRINAIYNKSIQYLGYD